MTRLWRIVLILSLLGNLAIIYVSYKTLEYRDQINVYVNKYAQVADESSRRQVFAQANRDLVSDSIVPGRVVFIGTQVTATWDLARCFPQYEAINRGIERQQVAGLLLRFRQDVINLAPEAVVVEISSGNFASNSSADEILDYVASMADMARANGIKPILTTVFPPTADYQIFEQPEYSVKDTVALYDRLLTDWASKNNYQLVDLCAAVTGPDGYLDPSLAAGRMDLNDAGYGRISERIAGALSALEVPAETKTDLEPTDPSPVEK
jgi:hypothetical protein